MEQLHLSRNTVDERICEYLINELDSNGFFRVSHKQLLKQAPFDPAKIDKALVILRRFEPHGIFVFNLEDCLKIQCLLSKDKRKKNAIKICDHLEAIALHHYDEIANATGLDETVIKETISFIQTLNPKPASIFANNAAYLDPEFKIKVSGDKIEISLLNSDLKLSFDASDDPNIQEYINKQRQEYKQLVSSLQKRNLTLMQIMECLCEIQRGFFIDHEPVTRCTMEMISQHCGISISTISRALSNKSFEFENHYYALKLLLSHGGNTKFSDKAIKEKIKDFIICEDKHHPLSDETIRKMLEDEGIVISRRAVAKYREALLIFNSSKRKIKT